MSQTFKYQPAHTASPGQTIMVPNTSWNTFTTYTVSKVSLPSLGVTHIETVEGKKFLYGDGDMVIATPVGA